MVAKLKANESLRLNQNAILWYIINIDVVSGIDIEEKVNYYQASYDNAQVNDIKEYTKQTLGSITEQIKNIVIAAILIALIIIVLITGLFLRMIMAKDMAQIAIMRSVGLTSDNVKHQ